MNWNNTLAGQDWNGVIVNKEEKWEVAKKVSEMVKDGQVIGVGSGSTSSLAVKAIAEKISKEKINVTAIPTSLEALRNCTLRGIPVTTLQAARPDWGFDGADEVDGDRRLIKGRGGALFHEKLVMASSPKTYILADESKFVKRLGEKFAVPMEIDPRAVHLVDTYLEAFSVRNVNVRMAEAKDGPLITEGGNMILDVSFSHIHDQMERDLSAIPGVIETGLFIGYSVEFLTD